MTTAAYVPPADNDPMTSFDPETRRNPGVPAVPVTLADNRVWSFAAATKRHRPTFLGDRFTGVETYTGFPPPCDGVTDQLSKAVKTDPDNVPVQLIVACAWGLLRKAHNLSTPETAALLHVDERGLDEIIRGVLDAFRGVDTTDDDMADAIARMEAEGGGVVS